MQARIRQLAIETAATFDFDIGQAAEIADGKSRYRLNRVFSTGELESPEETVKRYWRRAAEQPHVEGFIVGKTKGIEEAVEQAACQRALQDGAPARDNRDKLARAAGSGARPDPVAGGENGGRRQDGSQGSI